MKRDALITIRDATADDAEAIARIYNPYVRETTISFEEAEIDAAEMAQRMRDVAAAGLPWLVAVRGGEIAGYAYATAQGAGIGRRLYESLFAELRARGVHAVIAGIAQPNEASVALHEKLGMRKVAHFEQVGLKFGRWIDVGYWELVF